MATVNFKVNSKKSKTAPVYVRFNSGTEIEFRVNSGIIVDSAWWSKYPKLIKDPNKTADDSKIIQKLNDLRLYIEKEFKEHEEELSEEWLRSIIDQFNKKKHKRVKNLNEYISQYIREAKTGERKNKSSMNIAPGTIRIYEGFQRIFNEYQGVYTQERLEELQEQKKKPRPAKKIDFENITIDFYNSFVNFLTAEGYARNTMGRFIKTLKLIMRKAHEVDKLHNNLEFRYEAFHGISEDSFAVYLTKDELEKIYKKNLTKFPRMDLARDAFIVLCETCLRISDYKKIDINIRTIDKKRFIDIRQTKTGTQVIIPLTPRFEAIWKKYGNKLPVIPEQYVNKYIKSIASMCDINEELRWEGIKYGLKHQKSAKKYEIITCHTGRRTACTNMYLAGIPLKDIRMISGHSSDKQLLDYIKVDKLTTALRLSEHPYFNNLKAV
jgi:integrase